MTTSSLRDVAKFAKLNHLKLNLDAIKEFHIPHNALTLTKVKGRALRLPGRSKKVIAIADRMLISTFPHDTGLITTLGVEFSGQTKNNERLTVPLYQLTIASDDALVYDATVQPVYDAVTTAQTTSEETVMTNSIAIADATFAQLQAKAAELKLHEGTNAFVKYAVLATEAKPGHVTNLKRALAKAGVTHIELAPAVEEKPAKSKLSSLRERARSNKAKPAETVEPVAETKPKRARRDRKIEREVEQVVETKPRTRRQPKAEIVAPVVEDKPKRGRRGSKAETTIDVKAVVTTATRTPRLTAPAEGDSKAVLRIKAQIKALRADVRNSTDADERSALRKQIRALKAKLTGSAAPLKDLKPVAEGKVRPRTQIAPKADDEPADKVKLTVTEGELRPTAIRGEKISVKFKGDARAKSDLVESVKIIETGKGTKRDPKVRRRYAITAGGWQLPLAEITSTRTGKFVWNEEKLTVKVA